MYKEDVIAGVVILAIVVGIIWGSIVLLDYKCTSKWPANFKADFSVFTGCTIETKDGRIPSENYRVL